MRSLPAEKVLLNETKATPRYEYVKDLVEFVRSGEFLEFFPECEGKNSSQYLPLCVCLAAPQITSQKKAYAIWE